METNTYNKTDQIVVWEATIVGKDNVKKFETFLKEEGFRAKYATEFKTLPDKDDYSNKTGGRNDLLFYIHSDDISKFAIWRLQRGMRWWEDYLDNGARKIVPQAILKKFPYGRVGDTK